MPSGTSANSAVNSNSNQGQNQSDARANRSVYVDKGLQKSLGANTLGDHAEEKTAAAQEIKSQSSGIVAHRSVSEYADKSMEESGGASNSKQGKNAAGASLSKYADKGLSNWVYAGTDKPNAASGTTNKENASGAEQLSLGAEQLEDLLVQMKQTVVDAFAEFMERCKQNERQQVVKQAKGSKQENVTGQKELINMGNLRTAVEKQEQSDLSAAIKKQEQGDLHTAVEKQEQSDLRTCLERLPSFSELVSCADSDQGSQSESDAQD